MIKFYNMSGKNFYELRKSARKEEKMTWVKPAITLIELEKIRQEEVELYYRMMDNPEIFQRLTNSFETPN